MKDFTRPVSLNLVNKKFIFETIFFNDLTIRQTITILPHVLGNVHEPNRGNPEKVIIVAKTEFLEPECRKKKFSFLVFSP